jgi:hypothetical protein
MRKNRIPFYWTKYCEWIFDFVAQWGVVAQLGGNLMDQLVGGVMAHLGDVVVSVADPNFEFVSERIFKFCRIQTL